MVRLRVVGFLLIVSLLVGCRPLSYATPVRLPTLMPMPSETPLIDSEPQRAVVMQPTASNLNVQYSPVTVTPTWTVPPPFTVTPRTTSVGVASQGEAPTLPPWTVPPPFTSTPRPTLTGLPSPTPIDTVVAASQTPTLQPIVPTATPAATDMVSSAVSLYSNITYDDAFNLLLSTPRIVLADDHARLIYQRGRYRGLRDDFLLSVGDCNTESGWYLEPMLDDFDQPNTQAVTYDPQQLQSTIEYFTPTFNFKGQSVNSGLNAASVLDPFWANPDVCQYGDSPLTCDYQITDSFASLIMFGANDINVLTTEGYERAMRDIIVTTLERDIIPILSTFTVRPIEGSDRYATGVRFNGIIVKLAEEYNIPLVNFWLAARDLDDRGILTDNAHLTVPGFNIRNQLTIELLTQLRVQVMN